MENSNIWLTVIPIIISLIAVCQTWRQTALSNKQSLFEKRLEVYFTYKKLLNKAKQLNEKCKLDTIVIINNKKYYNGVTHRKVVSILTQLDEFTPNAEGKIMLSNPTFYPFVDRIALNSDAVALLWKNVNAEVANAFHDNYKDVLSACYDSCQNGNENLLLGVDFAKNLLNAIEPSEKLLNDLKKELRL